MEHAINGFDLRELPAKVARFDRTRVLRAFVEDVIKHSVLGLRVQCAKPRYEALVADDVQQWPSCKIPTLVITAVVIGVREHKSERDKIAAHSLLKCIAARQTSFSTVTIKPTIAEHSLASLRLGVPVVAGVCASDARAIGAERDNEENAQGYAKSLGLIPLLRSLKIAVKCQ
jgi:hypothetical protein